MRMVLLGILLALMVAQTANAQTNQRATPVPTPHSANALLAPTGVKLDGYSHCGRGGGACVRAGMSSTPQIARAIERDSYASEDRPTSSM